MPVGHMPEIGRLLANPHTRTAIGGEVHPNFQLSFDEFIAAQC